jgi:hypothetical protein
MRHALLLYCAERQMSFGEAVRLGLARLFKEAAVREAAAVDENRVRLQELDAKIAEHKAKLAGIERGKARMAALGEEGLYQLMEMVVPAVTTAAQAPDKQLLPRVMHEALPAVLQTMLSTDTHVE